MRSRSVRIVSEERAGGQWQGKMREMMLGKIVEKRGADAARAQRRARPKRMHAQHRRRIVCTRGGRTACGGREKLESTQPRRTSSCAGQSAPRRAQPTAAAGDA